MPRIPNIHRRLTLPALHRERDIQVLDALVDRASLSRDELYRHAGYPFDFAGTLGRLLADERIELVEVQSYDGDIRIEYALAEAER